MCTRHKCWPKNQSPRVSSLSLNLLDIMRQKKKNCCILHLLLLERSLFSAFREDNLASHHHRHTTLPTSICVNLKPLQNSPSTNRLSNNPEIQKQQPTRTYQSKNFESTKHFQKNPYSYAFLQVMHQRGVESILVQ